MRIEQAYFELTNICNLNCKTCYNRSGLNRERREIPLDALLHTIDTFRRYGLSAVQLSGGETMLYTQIVPLLESAKRMPEMHFSISTNGTVNADLLLQYYRIMPNLYVQLSLDGASEEVNAETRGKGNFAKSLQLLRGLHESERPVGYRIKMVLSKYNLDDIPAYFRLASEYGCAPQFSLMNAVGNGAENWDDMGLSDSEKMKILRYIDEENKKYGTEVKLPFCAFSCPYADEPDNVKVSCMVTSEGNIMPCQALYDPRYRLGNIYSFDEGEMRRNMEEMCRIATKRLSLDFGCEKCLIAPLCKRGCPAEALLKSGDILGSDGECSYRLKHYLKYQFKR